MIKTLGTQLALFYREPEVRRNLRALAKYLILLVAVIALYSILFHVIMSRAEGQEHTWFSGVYWTLVTMSTLGFGDITFHTDLGRAFSILVLFSGVILLLVVLPFAFITYLYAPWLQAQLRLRAPRSLPGEIRDHVILCDYDSVAESVIEQLDLHKIPYVILDPDPERASRRHADGLRIVTGPLDAVETFRGVGADRAKLVVVNADDISNTNVILTVREVSATVPIAAVASTEDTIDVLQLAGATHVFPLWRQLGERLASRINAGRAQVHEIGRFRDLVIGEFPVLNTPLAGKRIEETSIRELLGINIVAVWDRGKLVPSHPKYLLTEHCLPVIIGTAEQLEDLDEFLFIYDTNWNPVIVLGGGKVGRAATRRLKAQGVPVHIVERKPDLAARWSGLPDRMIVGDASSREVLHEAGIEEAPAILLTTNDDAMNVFLAVYCRRLNPSLRIVSRVTHERNVASILRAGADLVLSYAALGMEAIISLARERTLVLLGEGVELFEEALPSALAGATLAESAIRARTGLNVVAVEAEGRLMPAPRAGDVLQPGSRLYMIGTPEQHFEFSKEYGLGSGAGAN
ncbi:MAG: NAD-binding protein [Gemmatimonadota bacterium]